MHNKGRDFENFIFASLFLLDPPYDDLVSVQRTINGTGPINEASVAEMASKNPFTKP